MDTLILDLLDSEEARRPPMALKDYSDEFRADAVALYESTPGATHKSIAADLGINRAALRQWVLRDRERRGIARPLIRTSGSGGWRPGWPSLRPANASSQPSGTFCARLRSISPERRTGEEPSTNYCLILSRTRSVTWQAGISLVVPAPAGMVPRTRSSSSPGSSAPRTRGDGPASPSRRSTRGTCSPHPRG